MKILKCGHPGKPENLLKGRCGTCSIADELETMELKEAKQLAVLFRTGVIIYNRKKGKTLIQWEKELRK